MSIMPSYAAVGTIKDPRPIRDRTFQSDCHTNIQEFLARRKVQLALTPKWLSSPTQRDFQNVFRYLADELVGPGFPWGKKFEDDCIAIMRDLRYPVMDAVGKTALTAPGSPNAWPNVLAMLNWMVDLCNVSCTVMCTSLTGSRRPKNIATTRTSYPTLFFVRRASSQSTTRRLKIGSFGISVRKRIENGSRTGQKSFPKLSANWKRHLVRPLQVTHTQHQSPQLT